MAFAAHLSFIRIPRTFNEAPKTLYKHSTRNNRPKKTYDNTPVTRKDVFPEASLKSSIQNADTYPHKVKKANHPKGWDAKPRDPIWEVHLPRVRLVATGFTRCTDLNAPIHRKDGRFHLRPGNCDEGSIAERHARSRVLLTPSPLSLRSILPHLNSAFTQE